MGLYDSGYSDEFVTKGFLSKEDILSYATESQIFYMVFGFFPKEYQYTVSPFRDDKTPGAFFENFYLESEKKEKMYFVDWADPNQINRDCFDCVRDKFGLDSFYHTLDFIRENLIFRNNLQKIVPTNVSQVVKTKKKTKISIKIRRFMDQDKNFWKPYGITKGQLIKDNVFPVSKYLISKDENNYYNPVYTLTYAYSGFNSGNMKLYFPFKKKGEKFLTTCSKNDIGGLSFLFDSPKVVITKSYKDYRVLKNAGCNTIWFQNEGMIPDYEFLQPIIENKEDIIVFFDNDETGINASVKVANHINDFLQKEIARPLTLPTSYIKRGITDPSDLRKLGGQERLDKFLLKHNLYDK